MKNKALGIIETYGYSNFIVALDIATKSANVSYTKHNFIRGGLVSGYIYGDVSDVQVALQAAKIYLDRLKKQITIHCIPRPYFDTWNLIEPLNENKEKNEDVIIVTKRKDKKDEIYMKMEALLGAHINELKEMKTVDLRKLARQLDDFEIPRNKIKYAKKDELIKAIIDYCERKLR